MITINMSPADEKPTRSVLDDIEKLKSTSVYATRMQIKQDIEKQQQEWVSTTFLFMEL